VSDSLWDLLAGWDLTIETRTFHYMELGPKKQFLNFLSAQDMLTKRDLVRGA
jgi:hypothetical protein